jgi:hypothetical protein
MRETTSMPVIDSILHDLLQLITAARHGVEQRDLPVL